MRPDLVDAVLERLGVSRPAPDLTGLRLVYAAWCRAVPFDNSRKMIHVAEARPGPLPGSTPEDFFAAWLAYGTGGTCWAGNGALHAFLAALDFDASRAMATMLPRPDLPGPNHGSVVVRLDGELWIADASILSGTPIRLLQAGDPERDGPLPRPAWHEGKPAVLWQALVAPEGFPCRFDDRIGAGDVEWDAIHQRTAEWSPFNYQLNGRLLREGTSIGIAHGQRFAFAADGSYTAEPIDHEGRIRFLIEELGIAEELAARVPDDQELPPRPDDQLAPVEGEGKG
jgi:N-hydroxyarylamine O-acetyltransferase